jgi:hypothetical protein
MRTSRDIDNPTDDLHPKQQPEHNHHSSRSHHGHNFNWDELNAELINDLPTIESEKGTDSVRDSEGK